MNKNSSYKYVYYWVNVDLCNAGTECGPYGTKFSAEIFKPSQGTWVLKKKRAPIVEEKEIRVIRDHCGPNR